MKTFALLAYVIASGNVYVLDFNMSGAGCIAAIEAAPARAWAEPAFETIGDELLLDLSGAVLSCEEERG